MAAFVTILLVSNLIGAIKITRICLWEDFCFSATTGLFIFPVSYLIGDILTEVYGYARSRRIIWTGFTCLFVANLLILLFRAMPADPSWGLEDEFTKIFSMSFRLSMASMIAYFFGEFTNSFVIAKLKVITKGKYQALRIIGSTAAGELVDSILILFIGFYGNPGYPLELLGKILVVNYSFKVVWEIIAYPLTSQLLKYLKKEENEDYFDTDTDFNPFHHE